MYEIAELEPSIVVVTWRKAGTPAAFREYFAWHHERVTQANERGERLVVVHDARAITTRLDPETRHVLAELTEDQSLDQSRVLTLLVHDNMIVRGVLTALSWVSPQARSVHTAKSLDEARQRARAFLQQAA